MICNQLNIIPGTHRVVAVVGAGGKTSLIYTIAEELRRRHKKIIITTTTHMYQPKQHFLPSLDEKRITLALQSFGVLTIGSPCESGKIKMAESLDLSKLKSLCDVVLIEADGAHRKPMKVPSDFEPVIPPQTDLVIGLQGASAVGKTLAEACHRFELASKILEVDKNHIITTKDLEYLLQSEQGQKKNVVCAYHPVIGQADYLAAGETVSNGITAIVLRKRSEREGNKFV